MQPVSVHYDYPTGGKLSAPLTLAVISDLHNEPFEPLLPLLAGADALLVPGDISDRYRQRYDMGVAFLTEAAKRLPTFFSLGNHEACLRGYKALRRALNRTGAEILVNRHVRFGELCIGGWYDPSVVREPERLSALEREQGFKILLCHKPDQYMRRMRGRNLDLVVAGHAHGGQIRIHGQGLYAPGQGLFPRYTRGLIDERMIVSAGVGNPARMPRWGNPPEVVFIHLLEGSGTP